MKQITQVKCIEPFTVFGIHPNGYCYPCCPVWLKVGDMGRLNDQNSIMDIWNGPKMQRLRKAILDDNLENVCDSQYCPYAIKKDYLNLETLKNNDPKFNHIIDQIMAGRTIMDNSPYTLFVSNSTACNLNCTMCDSDHKYPESDKLLDEKLFTRIIPEILPDVSKIFMSGHGEVLFNPHSRKFLQTLDPSRYPHLRIQLLTNGILFTPKIWESIRHNHYEYISVSIDAATKETYEKIRRNGKWDILRQNLDFISELRHRKIFEYFAVSFLVMKSNYQEMKDFVELGLSLSCDKIVFQKIHGHANIPENINLTRNQRVFAGIGQILTDPIFNRPEVDTALIDEYRKYADKRGYFWDRVITKGKEWYYLRKKQSI